MGGSSVRSQACSCSQGGKTIDVIAILLTVGLLFCSSVELLLIIQEDRLFYKSPQSLHHSPRDSLHHGLEAYIKDLKQVQKNETTQRKPLHDVAEMNSPIIIFTFRRADYLRRSLTMIWKHHPINKQGEGGNMGYPIVISQDGNYSEVCGVIDEFQRKFRNVEVPFFHTVHPKLQKVGVRGNDAYKALAIHFGWALRRLFSGEIYKEDYPSMKALPLPQRVIILEEDIEVAPDFFLYMDSVAPLLDSDPTLLAVSSFNDNGKKGIVGNAERLVRSDFFPGLGWMISRNIWDEIGSKWPNGWWDDWLRQPEQRRGRQIIRPEVSRTFHFGVDAGASFNQFGKELLAIQLVNTDIAWEKLDLSYLKRDAFREKYYSDIFNAQTASWDKAEVLNKLKEGDVRVEFINWKQFERNVLKLVEMISTDEKSGVPRTAFENIIETRPDGKFGHLLFFSPPLSQIKENFEKGKMMDILDFSETLRVVPPPKLAHDYYE